MIRMRLLIGWAVMGLFLSLLISGCDEGYSPDLYAADANARATQLSAEARREATQAAWEQQSRQATMEAAKTLDAQRAAAAQLQAQGTATAEMLASQMTATQAAWMQQSTATQAAIAYQQTQPAATATAGALAAAMKREADTQLLRTWSGWALMGMTVAAVLTLMWVLLVKVLPWALVRLFGVVQWGGKPVVIAPTHGGVGVIDYTRALGPGTILYRRDGSVEVFGHVDDALQSQAAARSQAAELLLAAGGNGKRVLAQAGMQKFGMGAGAEVLTGLEVEKPLPPAPAWSLMERWPGRALLLGVGSSGAIAADPETTPHLLVAGTTGSGKTRYGLRPLIAAALGGSWQVAIFDRSGLDFQVFEEHPNCRLITLDQGEAAIWYLQALYAEIRRRFEILTEARASAWGRLPGAGPRLMAVFDEFGNLADGLPGREREELWRWARMCAAEGRKAGVHLMIALQDPTHRSIDLRIRRNMAAMAFRVRDGEASRVTLNAGGAEELGEREFLATLGGKLARGMAFAPTDAEIERMLDSRAVRIYEGLQIANYELQIKEGVDERVKRLAAEGLSMNEIQRQVYGYTGGKAYEEVRKALGDQAREQGDGDEYES